MTWLRMRVGQSHVQFLSHNMSTLQPSKPNDLYANQTCSFGQHWTDSFRLLLHALNDEALEKEVHPELSHGDLVQLERPVTVQ